METFGSGLSTSRNRAASSGVEMVASRLKYAAVVSFSLIGGTQVAAAATAEERWVSALFSSGMEPCPAGPRAVSSMARGIFSVVATEAYFTAPPMRVTPPPSARQYSASMASKWSFAMCRMPTRVVPSSPASARKITSRSSATFSRFSRSIVIRPAATSCLLSTAPRP